MDLRPKKSLGQNFLKSKEALRDIITAASIQSTDIILEIGPGKGVLTKGLLALAKKVIAIEKDSRMVEFLQGEFKSEIESGTLEMKEADILEFDPSALPQYKLVANIPYYITGALIQKFLTTSHQPTRMVLLLQKEVAQRIVARDNKESILSLSVKAYGTPIYKGTVKAKYFSPEPKVDSGILLVENISKHFFTENNIKEEQFFKVVKAGFAHKRKMLAGNLHTAFPELPQETIHQALIASDINEKARAEDITMIKWKQLIKALPHSV